jgi:hypothetical protein
MRVNFMASVDLSPEWRTVEVPFVRLEPQGKVPEGTRFEPGELRMIGISTPYVLEGEAPPADVRFEIDDVEVVGAGEGSAAGPPDRRGRWRPSGSRPSRRFRHRLGRAATDPKGDASAAIFPT